MIYRQRCSSQHLLIPKSGKYINICQSIRECLNYGVSVKKYYVITEEPYYPRKLNHNITLRGKKIGYKTIYIGWTQFCKNTCSNVNSEILVHCSAVRPLVTLFPSVYFSYIFKIFTKLVYYFITRKKEKLEKLILKRKHFFDLISCFLSPIHHLHFLGLNFMLKESIRPVFLKLCSIEPYGTTRGFWVSSND